MRRLTWLAIFLAAAFGLARAVAAQDRGTAKGVVQQVEAQVREEGPIILVVTLKGEGVWEARFEVGPDNREAYATVGGLKKGDRVTIGWVRAGELNLIREIRVEGREGEGERREGDRREGEDVKPGPRDGEGVKPGPRDGEGVKPGPRDGERREGAAREAERREGAAREEDQRRAEAAAAEKKRELEARQKNDAARDEAARREAEQREVQRREAGQREGAAREGERREGVRPERRQMKGTVVSVATQEAEEGEGPRILRVAPLEGGEGVTFSVGADRRKLYEIVGELRPGEKVTVVWVTEAGRPWLVEIGKAE